MVILTETMTVNAAAMESVIIEIKLHINRKLFEKGIITEEMHTKAKEMILKSK